MYLGLGYTQLVFHQLNDKSTPDDVFLVGNGKKTIPSITAYFSMFRILRQSDVQPGTTHQYFEIFILALKQIVHHYNNMPNKSVSSCDCGA